MGAVLRFTALVLSPEPVRPALPHGVALLNHCETFNTTAGINAARRRAMARVDTEWVFWLDSDDELPADAASVLGDCAAAGLPLAYTDELVISGGTARVRRAAPHHPALHAFSPMLVHHLAVMRTADALQALQEAPTGEHWIEQPLYWLIAQGGAAYIPRIGYHWHRREHGMHRASGIVAAQARSAAWCASRLGMPGRDALALARAVASQYGHAHLPPTP